MGQVFESNVHDILRTREPCRRVSHVSFALEALRS